MQPHPTLGTPVEAPPFAPKQTPYHDMETPKI